MAISIPILGDLAKGILQGLDGLFTSDEERENARNKIMETLQQPAILQAMTNIEEAKHASVFVAGWRPFIGWSCGIGILYSFVVRDIAIFIASLNGADFSALPELEIGQIIGLVTAMLGLSTQRTYEKVAGVHRESL